MMASFADAPSCDMAGLTSLEICHGRVTAETDSLVAADYHGAMPNASGGAVLLDTLTFGGTHVGAVSHKSTESCEDAADEVAPLDRSDLATSHLWNPGSRSQGCTAPSASDGQGSVDAEAEQLVAMRNLTLHAVEHVGHKDQLALFVPADAILILGQAAGAIPNRRFPTHLHSTRSRSTHKMQVMLQ
jgi:hypothetical protein